MICENCGKECKGRKGLKIHQTKSKCGGVTQHCTQKGKTERRHDQEQNHSIVAPPAVVIQIEVDKREKVKWPVARSQEWKVYEQEVIDALELVKGNVEVKVVKFMERCYKVGVEKFGVMRRRVECELKGKDKLEGLDLLRREKNVLRKKWRKAKQEEKEGIGVLWAEVRKRYMEAWKARKKNEKRRKRAKARKEFVQDPYKFAKKLFVGRTSGVLRVSKTELEEHVEAVYSDKERDSELQPIDGLVWPGPPGKEFDVGELRWKEVTEFVRKARSGSAPGANGIPYKVFKSCPGLLRELWKILKVVWRRKVVCETWCSAEGVYIPKEVNATEIGQFRPISLLNVDGKIMFGIIAKRLTDFVMSNGYINTSIQKAGIPGFAGCVEHGQAIWETIQLAKEQKGNLDVIWLDLVNAYGSVPHKVIEEALKFFHVPEVVIGWLMEYYKKFRMRFSVEGYTTRWQKLEVGVPMGCTVSPLLFVLAMEMLLRGVDCEGIGSKVGSIGMPAVRAFMDDLTILSQKVERTKQVLERLDQLITWARMAFKPKKSRCLSLRKGVPKCVTFSIGGERMPTVGEEPVRSLGRWYQIPLSDKGRGMQVQKQVEEGLIAIERSGLQGKFKAWCLQFGLIPRVLWPLTIYNIGLTRVERMEQKITARLRKWLGFPKMLSNQAMYGRSNALVLPFVSIVEEFKCRKVGLAMMMRESPDMVIAGAEPRVEAMRKWNPVEELEEAVEGAKFKEVRGAVARGREGIGCRKERWWSRQDARGRRAMVIEEVREKQEEGRVVDAVQQSQQGGWTKWDEVEKKKISWSKLWALNQCRLKFVVAGVYDVLPTQANLVKWGVDESVICKKCNAAVANLEHVLSSCKAALQQYTRRHNEVLKVMKEVVEDQIDKAKREGGNGWLRSIDDWQMNVELSGSTGFPRCIAASAQKPDLVVWSPGRHVVEITELTVPWETRLQYEHERKLEKYFQLSCECKDVGWKCNLSAVEVGCRGFVGASMVGWLKRLGVKGIELRKVVKRMEEVVEGASSWIMFGGGKGD